MKRVQSENDPSKTSSDYTGPVLVRTGLKNVALGWNEKRLLKYRRFEASALMPWIYSVRWRHINQWPCRHPMKDHLLVVIYAIQSVSLFWRENFDFKFMISDHKWLNRKLIKTFFVISKFYAAKEMSGPGGPGEPGRITVEFVWLARHSERANKKRYRI